MGLGHVCPLDNSCPQSDFSLSHIRKCRAEELQCSQETGFISSVSPSEHTMLLQLVGLRGLALGGSSYQTWNFSLGSLSMLAILILPLICLSDQELKEQVLILQHCSRRKTHQSAPHNFLPCSTSSVGGKGPRARREGARVLVFFF